MRADILAMPASRNGLEWANLGRRAKGYGRRGLTNVQRVAASESGSSLVELVTDGRALASIVADLERGAALNPPSFSSSLELEAAKKDCENALRSVVLVRDRLRVMSEVELVLWARLSICAVNVEARGARRVGDVVFDEMHRRGMADAHRLVHGRFLVCCPGRELQALQWLAKCSEHGVDDDVRYLRAWAKIWMSDVDGAIAELKDREDPQQITLLDSIRRDRARIAARSRFLEVTEPTRHK